MQGTIKKASAFVIRGYNSFLRVLAPARRFEENFEPMPSDIVKAFNKTRILGPQKHLCYAPFKMMYFAFNGEVIACCHNRKHVLGRYPEQSITEIWNDTEYSKLRDYIRNDDLSYGCDVCKHALLAGNFDGAKNGLYDRYRIRSFPQVMEFELDNRCNLACVICNGIFSSCLEKTKGQTHSISPYDENFVRQLIPFIPHLKEAKFYGGEPFLIPLYFDIWSEMIKHNPCIHLIVQTNGTVLNDKVRNMLEKARFSINISIDSFQKENFEKIRANANFETTLHNLVWFRDYCKQKNTHLGIIPTPNRLNVYDLPELTNRASEYGAKVYFNTLVTPLDLALWNLPTHELEMIAGKLSKEVIAQNSNIAKQNSKHFNDFLKQLSSWSNKNKTTAKKLVTEEQIQLLKKDFLSLLKKSLQEKNCEDLFTFFEQTYSMFETHHNRDLFFVIAQKIPMNIVIEELSTRNPEHLKMIMGKKIYECSNEYELAEKTHYETTDK